MATIHTYARYGAVMGVFGEWHPFVFRILQLMAPKGEVGIAYIYSFTAKLIAQWKKRSDKEHAIYEEKTEGGALLQTDYLGSLLAKHRRDPQHFKVDDAFYHISSNVVAGGETTGISLAAAIHLLVQYPQVLEKLRQELDGLKKGPNERVSMKDAQNCTCFGIRISCSESGSKSRRSLLGTLLTSKSLRRLLSPSLYKGSSKGVSSHRSQPSPSGSEGRTRIGGSILSRGRRFALSTGLRW